MRMFPSKDLSPVEERSYKDYVYNPVSTLDASTHSRIEDSNCKTDDNLSHTRSREIIQLTEEMDSEGSKKMQFAAAAAANLAIVACGTALAWTSPVFPKLLQDPIADDNPLGRPSTEEENSWIAGFVSLGAIFGSFFGGYLSEKIGRKGSILFSAAPFIVAWILVATGSSVYQIYVARFLMGFALAIDFTCVPMYCGEIAETSIRGTLGSFLQLFITVGLLYSYVVGPYVSYTVLWIACLCIPIIFIAAFIKMPESPYYLLSKGGKKNREAAIDALARLRSKSKAAVQDEANEIETIVQTAFNSQAKVTDLFTNKANRKALIFLCAMASFQQLTGINVVLMFTQDIFKDTGSTIPAEISTIIVGIVQVVASCITPLVVDRLGRRLLLLASGAGTALTTGALGLFFYLKNETDFDVSTIAILPVISLAVFIFLYSIGWGPLPWAVMGEMFAPEVKGKASGITVCICWLLSFLITKFFSNIKEAFGSHTAFWIFCACCIASVLFVVFILPETKGKTLKEIQDELNGVKK